jgi:hypothetical protein
MPLALANGNSSNAPTNCSKKPNNYEDAGILVDIGPVSTFNGITKTGTGPLFDNVWVTNGSQAFSPGLHPLSAMADFNFYFDAGGGHWTNIGGPPPPSGCPSGSLTTAQIVQCYSGYEAYAFVGVQSNGMSTVTGHIASVNGKSVSADVTLNSTTAAVR